MLSNWLFCITYSGGSHAIRTHDHRIKRDLIPALNSPNQLQTSLSQKLKAG